MLFVCAVSAGVLTDDLLLEAYHRASRGRVAVSWTDAWKLLLTPKSQSVVLSLDHDLLQFVSLRCQVQFVFVFNADWKQSTLTWCTIGFRRNSSYSSLYCLIQLVPLTACHHTNSQLTIQFFISHHYCDEIFRMSSYSVYLTTFP
jgi:hypothetical protein